MAVRIQLRRDLAANWSLNNPSLRPGEVGIETDTLKFKIGPANPVNGIATPWNSITAYANVVPSDLNNTLNGYLETGDLSVTVAELTDGDLYIPGTDIIFEGTANSHELTLTAPDVTSDKTITLPDATTTLVGTDTTDTLTNKTLTSPTITSPTLTGTYLGDGSIVFEGATADSYETTVSVTEPTADRTITLPDVTGTIVTTGDTGSVTNSMLAGSIANNKLSNSSVTINGYTINLGASATYGTDNIGEGTTNLYFTNERAQDAVGDAVGNGLDYNDTTGAISVDPSEFALNAVGNPTADVSMASYKITNLATPTSANDAANKAYVDNTTAGLNFHAPVHAATTANLNATYANGTGGVGATLTNAGTNAALTIDGHALSQDERVLVKNQSTAYENGVYSVTTVGDGSTPWVLTRATDADNSPSGEVAYGDFTFVQQGSTNAGYGYIVNTTGTITIGTTGITYVQFNAGQVVVAGNGLSESTPGTLSIDTTITADLSTAQTFTNKTLTSPNVNEAVALTATATELNVLDGITSSTAELNILDGVTATAAELNVLDGITASTAELNILDGVTASAPELNILDGATLTTTELNYVDGVTSAIQTQLDGKVDESIITAKGDLYVGSANATLDNLAVGTNGYLLTADSNETLGVKWAAAPVSLPDQTGNNGKYLTTDGSSASWATLVVPIETGTATLTANTATTISTTALSAFTSIEYMVSLKQGSKVRTSKVVMQTDGTSVDMTEFAITETGGSMSGVVISATTASTNAVLQATVTDASSTNVDVKFSKVKL